MKGSLNIQTGSTVAYASQVEAETGTNNTKAMTPLRVAEAIAALGGGGGVDVQEFTADGTWTNPSPTAARMVKALLIGGGGGSGRRGSSGQAGGGGGGGPGLMFGVNMVTTSLGATENVIIGLGGLGGSSITTDNISGNAGTAGSGSSLGSLFAPGGTAGLGGTGTSTNTGGAAQIGGNAYEFITTSSLAGGNGSNSNAPSLSALVLASGSPGVGGGGGGGNSSVENFGRTGTQLFLDANNPTYGGLGGSNYGDPGGNGELSRNKTGSGAGGGAGGSATIPGGNGGNGVGGSGGGGGGGSVNGANSGAGGNGGDGYVLIITY